MLEFFQISFSEKVVNFSSQFVVSIYSVAYVFVKVAIQGGVFWGQFDLIVLMNLVRRNLSISPNPIVRLRGKICFGWFILFVAYLERSPH